MNCFTFSGLRNEDYADILPDVKTPLTKLTFGDAGRGTWRDLAAYLTVSAVELFRVTGKPSYRADAIRFGSWLADLQEQSFIDGSPVTGYFYADAARTQIQRELYGSCDGGIGSNAKTGDVRGGNAPDRRHAAAHLSPLVQSRSAWKHNRAPVQDGRPGVCGTGTRTARHGQSRRPPGAMGVGRESFLTIPYVRCP